LCYWAPSIRASCLFCSGPARGCSAKPSGLQLSDLFSRVQSGLCLVIIKYPNLFELSSFSIFLFIPNGMERNGLKRNDFNPYRHPQLFWTSLALLTENCRFENYIVVTDRVSLKLARSFSQRPVLVLPPLEFCCYWVLSCLVFQLRKLIKALGSHYGSFWLASPAWLRVVQKRYWVTRCRFWRQHISIFTLNIQRANVSKISTSTRGWKYQNVGFISRPWFQHVYNDYGGIFQHFQAL
jgi:hypothetical protein